jgi:hypothetical protein
MIRLAIALILVLLMLSSCSDEMTVEQQIIATIQEMEKRAEAGERAGFMEMVAGEFSGQLGSLSKLEFQRLMIMQWNQHSRLHAQLFPIFVRELGPGMATADFNALITGGRGLLPESGELFSIHTQWIQEGSDWLLVSADWEPVRMEQ